MTSKSSALIEDFIKKTGFHERFALEVRNIAWYDRKWIDWASNLGATWVSVDSSARAEEGVYGSVCP